MKCIYKYTDLKDNIVKYVGIVYAINSDIHKRVRSHRNDHWYKGKKWKIEYICLDGYSRTDIEFLESHFIALYSSHKFYNRAKYGWGISRFVPSMENMWEIYSIEGNSARDSNIINKLFKVDGIIYRVLDIEESEILVIDCIHRRVPKWKPHYYIKDSIQCTEEDLINETNMVFTNIEDADDKYKPDVYKKLGIIESLIPYVGDKKNRTNMVKKISIKNDLSEQTIYTYLLDYLRFKNISVFLPSNCGKEYIPSEEEIKMIEALNKYYFSGCGNSIQTVYQLFLKDYYGFEDENFTYDNCPSFYQFRYCYRRLKNKHEKPLDI